MKNPIFPLTLVGLVLSPAVSPAALVWHSALDGNALAIVGDDGILLGTGTTPAAIADKNGNPGGALSFSGTNRYYTIAANPAISSLTAGTLSFWFSLPSTTSGEEGIVAVGDTGGSDYFSIQRSGSTLRGDLDDGTTRRPVSDFNLSASQWYHAALTFTDGGTLRLYVDGTEEGTADLTGDGTYTGLSTWFLGTERNTSRFFSGALDDVRIYDEEISATGVEDLFNAGPLNIPEPSSIALFGLGAVGLATRRHRQ